MKKLTDFIIVDLSLFISRLIFSVKNHSILNKKGHFESIKYFSINGKYLKKYISPMYEINMENE